ncbi:MAG: response regulator [Bacteroidetes bacterium]|nr:response regulator [Bacteroidota bacterium]MBU1371474.1 response regulator [Bacteroidota bacterium]MBU1485704.1 response regulator [Bacteroidota bacterium]MBU1759505.1 response regulator [Bacteroidota bacterium]MBU2045847.1 response regulator [Bacteroidota bacterium]
MSKPFIICIVDDDAVYQFTTRKSIEVHNLARKILIFSDGEEAINFMIDNVANATDLPDIIFLDINMPIMDGFQFMEEYARLKPRIGKRITIYMVTSSVDSEDIERAKSISEISDYIVKPINPEQFKEIINALEAEGKL